MTKRIFRAIATVAFAVFLASFVLVMGVLYSYFTNVQQEQLKIETSLAAQGVASEGASYFDGLEVRGYRITWIDKNGDVIYDTQFDIDEMENHLQREEVIEAMEYGAGQSSRYSTTLMEKSVYAAQKLPDGTVLRVSDEHSSIVKLVFRMIQPVLLVAVITLVLALLIASRVSKRVVAPLNNLDLDNPLSNENVDEVAPLLRRINSQQRLLRIQEIELGKKQKEFDTVIKGMSEGFVLLNNERKIISINNAAVKIFDAGEFSNGKSIMEVSGSLEINEMTENAFAGGRITRIVEIRGKDYEIEASPIVSEGVSGLVLMLFDVTEKEHAEQMRREFTANVSHELKTPLHSISGCAELLYNDMVKPGDMKQFTGQIYTEAQRMMRLVNDIIYLSRLDEGALDMKREKVDIAAIARENWSSLRHEAEQAEVALRLTKGAYENGGKDGAPLEKSVSDDDSVMMDGVPQLVSSIVYNLCENAIKYNRTGGNVSIDISRTTEKNDNDICESFVLLTVTDTGIGIPPEHQARIFERFYRVDKSHSKEVGGTGLGLSIVKHAAKVHNAVINLNSAIGKGTTIQVKFPS